VEQPVSGRRRVTDRRGRPRFEVVGDLTGTLETVRPLELRNIGSGGALVESDRAWPVGSVHPVVVTNGSKVGRAQVCVRHVSQPDDGARRYLIGIEFLSTSPGLMEEIARRMAEENSHQE